MRPGGRSSPPQTVEAPFDPRLGDLLAALAARIESIESTRGPIPRTALAPAAQLFQDFIDRLLFALTGLTLEEATGLEERLVEML